MSLLEIFGRGLGRVDISEPDSIKSNGYSDPTISDMEEKSDGYSKCQHGLVHNHIEFYSIII